MCQKKCFASFYMKSGCEKIRMCISQLYTGVFLFSFKLFLFRFQEIINCAVCFSIIMELVKLIVIRIFTLSAFSMKITLLFFIFYLPIVAFASDDPRLQKAPYKLPKGVTSRDYLPNKIVIKFKAGSDPAAATFSGIEGFQSLIIKSAEISGIRQLFQMSRADEISVFKKDSKDTSGLDRVFEFNYSGK